MGPLTALRYVLTTLGSQADRAQPQRRSVPGPASETTAVGSRDPELRITKAGDRELRRLLVQCALYEPLRNAERPASRRKSSPAALAG